MITLITERDLKEAIAECQGVREPNANTCVKLAAFYIILDHISHTENTDIVNQYSYAPAPAQYELTEISYKGESDFAKKIDGADLYDVLEVIDELMDTLQILNPNLYAGVMRKLSEI